MFLEEQNLLCWIKLIENPKLYEAVKTLSIEDQIFISYIIKERKNKQNLPSNTKRHSLQYASDLIIS